MVLAVCVGLYGGILGAQEGEGASDLPSADQREELTKAAEEAQAATNAALKTRTDALTELHESFGITEDNENSTDTAGNEAGKIEALVREKINLEKELKEDGTLDTRDTDRLAEINTKIDALPADQKAASEAFEDAEIDVQDKGVISKAANKELANANSAVTKAKNKAALEKLSSESGSFDTGIISLGNSQSGHLDATSSDDQNIIQRLLQYLITIAGTFGVLMMIVGGFFMVTSEGDDNRLQKGKNIFLYTILGIVVIFVSYIIVQFVISVLLSLIHI